MSKVRLPLWSAPQKFATVESEATVGATVGRDLFWPDGTLVVLEDLEPLKGSRDLPPGTPINSGPPSTDPPDQNPVGTSIVLWSLLYDIPPNVTAVAGLATAGFVRRDGAGNWTASPIVNADLAGATTDGLAEGVVNLYAHVYTHTQASASATWTINHNLGFNPAVELLTVGGAEFDAEVLHTSVNQTVVYLTTPLAGTARLN